MLVKCAHCKDKKIDKATAYKVVVGGKNKYYCSKAEYDAERKEKEYKDKVYKLITGVCGQQIISTALYKEWTIWNQVADNEKIASYIEDNFDYLHTVMHKYFASEYAMIRYFSAILRNHLADYKVKEKVEIERSIAVAVSETFYDVTNNNKRKRRSLEELEDMF